MNGDQSTAQDGNSVTNHHTQQHPHFIQVQPAGSYSNGNNDGSGSNDSESMENGSDLLAKILNVTKQDHGNGIASTSRNNRSSPMSANGGTKRPGRVSSVWKFYCYSLELFLAEKGKKCCLICALRSNKVLTYFSSDACYWKGVLRSVR